MNSSFFSKKFFKIDKVFINEQMPIFKNFTEDSINSNSKVPYINIGLYKYLYNKFILDDPQFVLPEHQKFNNILKEIYKKLENAKLKEAMSQLQSIEKQINTNSIDYSIWANLYSISLFNVGFYKSAIGHINTAITCFETNYSQENWNIYLLNLQLNQLSIKSALSQNFEASRMEFLKFIALATSSKNKNLLIKAYNEYASFLLSSSQKRASIPYSKIAYKMQKEIVPFDYNLYTCSAQTIISSQDSSNFFARKRAEKFCNSVLTKNLEMNDHYSEAFMYVNKANKLLLDNKYNDSLQTINKAIDVLKQNGYEDKLLATAYIKKWKINEYLGRTIISKGYLYKANEIMSRYYGTGSFELSKFYQSLILEYVSKNNTEEAKKYVSLNNQVVSGLTHNQPNIFTLQNAFVNVCSSLNDNFTDLLVNYTTFRKINDIVMGETVRFYSR